LTGIHLLRTGHIEANLQALNDDFQLPYIPELIERKVTGTEKGVLPQVDLALHSREFERLVGELDAAAGASSLPEAPTARPALNDLLVRIRLAGLSAPAGE
jgi:hypothetical protein